MTQKLPTNKQRQAKLFASNAPPPPVVKKDYSINRDEKGRAVVGARDFEIRLPSLPSFSFGGGAAPVAAAKVVTKAAEVKEGPSALFFAMLLLFSPLLIVQLLSVQTIARLAGQVLGGSKDE